MTVLLVIAVGTVIIVGALALALPCAACRKRRERLRAAFAARRKQNFS